MAPSNVEQRVLDATRRHLEGRGWKESVELDDAVCQDLLIFGIDVDEYVGELNSEFGEIVWTIPWGYYTDQTGSYRGCRACVVAPFLVPWMLFKKVAFGAETLTMPNPKNFPHRLTLRQIAQVIERGGWPIDWRPE